jgi:hypothetical protein
MPVVWKEWHRDVSFYPDQSVDRVRPEQLMKFGPGKVASKTDRVFPPGTLSRKLIGFFHLEQCREN